jgi:GTP-binding protein HflX
MMYQTQRSSEEAERALVVGVSLGGGRRARSVPSPGDDPLEELSLLVQSAGADVVGSIHQNRAALDSAFLIGRGKVEELAEKVAATRAEIVVFDRELTPAQGKNIEEAIGVRILDRSELILDIFARRARTREARLQVELAQLQYLLPRLKRMWTHLSRIRGGIGLRGPGETQLEVDRRAIRARIGHLKQKLAGIRDRRETQRKARSELFNVALVGYTNAGKSTILNRLAGARVGTADRLFETLDATTRRVALDERHTFLLTDTVGFVSNLPHHLVASFRATLEEVVEADLLLHVVDISDPEYEQRMNVVIEVLEGLGVEDSPRLAVLNKADLVAPEDRDAVIGRARRTLPRAVVTSAVAHDGLEELEVALREKLDELEEEVWVAFPTGEARAVSELYNRGTVLERRFTNGRVEIRFAGRAAEVARLRREGLQVEPVQALRAPLSTSDERA